MPGNSGRPRRLAGRAALDAIASPARQELMAALGEGPSSVRDLAARLGRSRQALHYHVGILERAGLIRAAEWRGEGRAREAVYEVVGRETFVAARASSRSELEAGQRAARAMLRLTARELAEAVQGKPSSLPATPRRLFAMRGKARLSESELRRANALIDELLEIFAAPPASPEEQLFALTVVLTPSRDSHPKPRASREPKRRQA